MAFQLVLPYGIPKYNYWLRTMYSDNLLIWYRAYILYKHVHSVTGKISVYSSTSPVNKQFCLEYLAKTVLTDCYELAKTLTAVSFSFAELFSLVSYRSGIFNGAVIISMQLAETLTEGETDLLITDADNEWWESKLSILITFSDWNTGCVIFSVAMETWHHTSAELIHCEGHIEKNSIVLSLNKLHHIWMSYLTSRSVYACKWVTQQCMLFWRADFNRCVEKRTYLFYFGCCWYLALEKGKDIIMIEGGNYLDKTDQI